MFGLKTAIPDNDRGKRCRDRRASGGPEDSYTTIRTGLGTMAFNTPFKMVGGGKKRYEFEGGTSDPCIISWPGLPYQGPNKGARFPREVTPHRRSTSSDALDVGCRVEDARVHQGGNQAVPVRKRP